MIISVVLTGLVLVVDATTKSLGIISTVADAVTDMWLEPTVDVRVTRNNSGMQCLEFAFSSLPKNFALGRVELEVVDTVGPREVVGDQTADIFEETFHGVIDETVFLTREPVSFRAGFQATSSNDFAYVDYCPRMRQRGLEGTLYLRPALFAPGSKVALEDVRMAIEGGGESVEIAVNHPWNLVPVDITTSPRRR